MINLVFDMSNMFFRSMYIVGGYGKESYTFDDQSELDQLMRKVATDITYIVRTVNPSRVVLAMDSRSWRKDIEIEENEGYKGQREKAEHINWDNVYSIMDEFAGIIKKQGVIVSKIDTAEADDLMCLWRDEFVYNQNQHTIIVSGDADIRQLVRAWPHSDDKFAFATVFNPFKAGKSPKKLFVPKQFTEWFEAEDANSFFNMSIDTDKEDFTRLLNDQVELEVINGDDISMEKIFCGDDGDNVPAFWTWMGIVKSSGEPKQYRITKSKRDKILKHVNNNHERPSGDVQDWHDLVDKDVITRITESLEDIVKEPMEYERVKQRLSRQLKLVVLDPMIIPNNIVEDFQKELKEQKAFELHPQSWNMNTILEGTRYVNASRKNYNNSSVFKDLDQIIKQKELF